MRASREVTATNSPSRSCARTRRLPWGAVRVRGRQQDIRWQHAPLAFNLLRDALPRLVGYRAGINGNQSRTRCAVLQDDRSGVQLIQDAQEVLGQLALRRRDIDFRSADAQRSGDRSLRERVAWNASHQEHDHKHRRLHCRASNAFAIACSTSGTITSYPILFGCKPSSASSRRSIPLSSTIAVK
jgi:hypothetical protein